MKTFTVGALGRRFGLSRSALLYYDQIGLLVPSARSSAGYRLYTEEDAQRLERICLFRNAGLALEEIQRLLADTTVHDSLLEHRLQEIGGEISRLKTQQRLVSGLLRTVGVGVAASGLDKELLLGLQRAFGLSSASRKRWHE